MAENRDIAAEVKAIIKDQFNIGDDDIEMTSSFTEDLGADSLGLAELVLAFEDHFDISIPEEYAGKIVTVQDAITHIEQHLKQ